MADILSQEEINALLSSTENEDYDDEDYIEQADDKGYVVATQVSKNLWNIHINKNVSYNTLFDILGLFNCPEVEKKEE